MIKHVYSIFDEKSEAFLQPFFFDTKGQAIRAIIDCLTDTNHQFYRHTSDYTLFKLAEFDDENGSFKLCQESLGNLIEFKAREVNHAETK